ncbi:DNase I-like protein [Thozetella sp. PMI_491]|nr:DNase I-like protein [Thozetella sp. PMI_491]
MEELPTEINVVSLNVWGIKYISKLRNERITEIGRQLAAANPQPHIVALQECFTQEDYQSVRRETRFILPYGKFYNSAAFGGGLAILSRWPIEESTMFKYPLNGRPTAFWRGDWYVGKGVACAKIRYGPGSRDVVEVFNTHTHAPYEEGQAKDSYLCHDLAQSWEVAKLMRGAAERGHLVLGLGDFNMIPLSLAHRIVTAHAPVKDVWRVLHPDSSVGNSLQAPERARRRPVPTGEFNLVENGATADSVFNTWRWSKADQKRAAKIEIPPDRPDPQGKRIDYVFASYGGPPSHADHDLRGVPIEGWVVKHAKVGMTKPHPKLGCSLSDHFAVEATLVFHSHDPARRSAATASSNREKPETRSSENASTEDGEQQALHNGTYLQSPTGSELLGPMNFDAQLAAFATDDDDRGLPGSAYDEILRITYRYVARERSQQFWRGVHFFVSVAVTIACWIAVWFSPANFVAFILMLVSSLVLTTGTVDGLISLVFFNWELRALKEFEWEIMNAKAMASGGAAPGEEVREGDDPGW